MKKEKSITIEELIKLLIQAFEKTAKEIKMLSDQIYDIQRSLEDLKNRK